MTESPWNDESNTTFNWSAPLVFFMYETRYNVCRYINCEPSATKLFEPTTEHVLKFFFSLMIILGAVGNLLVIAVIVRTPSMMTARNMFILNLAISDLTLCLFTMPFTMHQLMDRKWIYGEPLCKLVGVFKATNVYVSMSSITAIALDRYQVIIYPSSSNMKKLGATITFVLIWLMSFALSTPLLFYTKTEQPFKSMEVYVSAELIAEDEIIRNALYSYWCIEDELTDEQWRLAYSIASFVVIYALPIVVISASYCRIYCRIRRRLRENMQRHSTAATATTRTTLAANNHHNHQDETIRTSEAEQIAQWRLQEDRRRQRKTTLLLVSIAAVFALSWLPLYLVNVIGAFGFLAKTMQIQHSYLLMAVCQLVGMSSACSNPILYGWLNDNFRSEFKQIFSCCRRSSCTRSEDSYMSNVSHTENHTVHHHLTPHTTPHHTPQQVHRGVKHHHDTPTLPITRYVALPQEEGYVSVDLTYKNNLADEEKPNDQEQNVTTGDSITEPSLEINSTTTTIGDKPANGNM